MDNYRMKDHPTYLYEDCPCLEHADTHYASILSEVVSEREKLKAEKSHWRRRALKLKHTLSGAAEYFDNLADDTDHDCGNFDGGSTADCESCQYSLTAKHYWAVIAGKDE